MLSNEHIVSNIKKTAQGDRYDKTTVWRLMEPEKSVIYMRIVWWPKKVAETIEQRIQKKIVD